MVAWRVFVEQFDGFVHPRGVHNELGVVGSAYLRGVAVLEPWRRASLERCHRHHARVASQYLLQAVGHPCRAFDGRPRRQVYLHGKLVAVGRGHHLLWQCAYEHDAGHGGGQSGGHRGLWPAEAEAYEPVVVALQQVEHRERLLPVLHWLAYEPELQERHEQRGNQQRHAQHGGDGPRESEQEVVYHSRRCEEEREESDAYGERCREYGLEEMGGALYRGMPARHALANLLEVVVDDDDRVVDNHAERQHEHGQRHRVQLEVETVEQAQLYEYGDGYGRGGHQGHP